MKIQRQHDYKVAQAMTGPELGSFRCVDCGCRFSGITVFSDPVFRVISAHHCRCALCSTIPFHNTFLR